MSSAPLVLASASPRRRELLAAAGIAFEVMPAGVDEELCEPASPEGAAEELAERKARAVARSLRGLAEPVLVLGADTVVAVGTAEPPGWLLLGKPEDAGAARAMLGRLSGTRHRVVTGVCVVRSTDEVAFVESETTWVTMRAIRPEEIEGYVASGEWRDKAGGYAIQETADRFVERLEEGGFDNVVGLPVERVRRLLARATAG